MILEKNNGINNEYLLCVCLAYDDDDQDHINKCKNWVIDLNYLFKPKKFSRVVLWFCF